MPTITGVTTHSSDVEPGSLFVAIRGTGTDGHDYIDEAVRAGAAAVVVDRRYTGDPGVPTVEVEDTRRTAAELASAWWGHPAARMRLVGITGSVGKTSVLSMLDAILGEAGVAVGTIGSLGVRVGGADVDQTGHTAPGPLRLHRELARIAEHGCELAAMEVTSHALVQERVHGLEFDLGIFTNLVPLEHSEYHPTFRDYIDAKSLFFEHLRDEAPVLYDHGNAAACRLVRRHARHRIGCGAGEDADVRIRPTATTAAGTQVTLELPDRLPHVHRDRPAASLPDRLPLRLRLLGRSNATNAAIAATAGLCLGAAPDAVRHALEAFPPPRRRMEIVHDGDFLVLDDTVGHPDSISALFEVVDRLDRRRVHVAFAVRGRRGTRLNEEEADALAVWVRRVDLGRLAVTLSREATDERNRVDDAEAAAFVDVLERREVPHRIHPRLDEAVQEVLEAAEAGDLVLLLGAQGMDDGQEIARAWLRSRQRESS